MSERPTNIEDCNQVRHWEGDAVIGANHEQAIVTVADSKSGYALIAKSENKTADLVGVAIVGRLKLFVTKVKKLTFDSGKEFCGHWPARVSLQGSLLAVSLEATRTSTGYCAVRVQEAVDGINNGGGIKIIENRVNNRPRKRLGVQNAR